MKAFESISDTARWVAAYRALESERKDALFQDSFARALAGERGFEIIRTVPGCARGYWSVVVRTCVFDELIQQAIAGGADAILNLAAGLDARPWRLELPGELHWIEVDLEDTFAYKTASLRGAIPRCRLTQIAQDLNDRARTAELLAKIGAEHRRVLVLTEGLLAYLSTSRVESLAEDLRSHPSFSWWLLDFLSPAIIEFINRSWGSALAAGGAKVQFAPPGGLEFFERFGWRVSDLRWAIDEAARLGRNPPSGHVLRLVLWLVGQKRREAIKRERLPGTVLLSRAGSH
jgi:methyltransferase (TIGR00027 family)